MKLKALQKKTQNKDSPTVPIGEDLLLLLSMSHDSLGTQIKFLASKKKKNVKLKISKINA